jgi:hypothetical protein
MRYELGYYTPEDGILHSYRRENLQSYIALTDWARQRRRNVFLVRYDLGFYIPENNFFSHHRDKPQMLHNISVH